MQTDEIRLECLRLAARGGISADEQIARAKKLEAYITDRESAEAGQAQAPAKRGPGRPRKQPSPDNPQGPG